ncbi:MAG: cobalamin-binding protein [candidate division Zixibacteria bacterium]|nr:cobalamin-binding protein [candidate division Zixibacteria bacterium]NIW48298.1 cobalamin-binding protein [Gammaproteobacteria bacterium]NIR66818.1 cobalamin-binding protein [candidate division Zixibacteria bacterium]NIS48322.1 cobalamin-binding protein [candidate division Zixibacteria bacterium]NIT51643.1 cobalamin-binding protein [candidate division Zixibacteria bacterium]
MDNQGGYIPVSWNPYQIANRIVDSVRRAVEKRLQGETLELEEEHQVQTTISKFPDKEGEIVQPEHSPDEIAALELVRQALVDFDRLAIRTGVQAALDAGLQPFDIVIHGMAEGMNRVGQLYETGEYFLPQLVMAGDTMKEGMTVLAPILKESGGEENVSRGKVILGTVKGDLHDIGKNLVRTMLEGARFEVIDLGVDVAPDEFIHAALEHQAGLVGLSALLTTTLTNMKLTVEAFDDAGLRDKVKIIVGGAPISQEFADSIGADGYAPTAVGAIKETERLLGLD